MSLEYINLVRKRCGLPTLPGFVGPCRTAFPRVSKLRKVLHQERSIEFLFEGRRFHDLRRWKEAPEVMNKQPRSWNRDGKTAGGVLPGDRSQSGRTCPCLRSPRRATGWPVPMSQINKNPNLVQNPGY